MEDLGTFLAFEVKKEIADRYFGFRKIIEEDTQIYKQKVIALSLDLEQSIGYDLVRVYTLLQDGDLVRDFFQLTGLSEEFFFHSQINKSTTARRRIFSDLKIHGLTAKSRFGNVFFDVYTTLYEHIITYRSALEELNEEHACLREQINLFYRKNDITGILHFLRSLDNPSEFSSLEAETCCRCDLDEKLKLYPPEPLADVLPVIPAIPPLKTLRAELKKLLSSAWSRKHLDPRRMQE